jgi:Zn-dependent protease with chaperone function
MKNSSIISTWALSLAILIWSNTSVKSDKISELLQLQEVVKELIIRKISLNELAYEDRYVALVRSITTDERVQKTLWWQRFKILAALANEQTEIKLDITQKTQAITKKLLHVYNSDPDFVSYKKDKVINVHIIDLWEEERTFASQNWDIFISLKEATKWNEDELAFVIWHEIGHIAVGKFYPNNGLVLQNVLREIEKESDLIGARLAHKAWFNPVKWSLALQWTRGGIWLTHPDWEERIETIKSMKFRN